MGRVSTSTRWQYKSGKIGKCRLVSKSGKIGKCALIIFKMKDGCFGALTSEQNLDVVC